MHQGRLQRKGFESKIRSKPQGEIEANQQQSKMNHHGDGMCMCGHESMVTDNIISILPFVTRDCQAIVGIHNSDDNYMKNISASRIARPMFGFTNNEMLCRILFFAGQKLFKLRRISNRDLHTADFKIVIDCSQ